MKNAAAFGLALALLLATAAPSKAANPHWDNHLVCGGNAFNTCALLDVTIGSQNAMGVSTVHLRMINASGLFGTYGGTVFTKIGFFNTGSATALGSSLTMLNSPVRGTDTPPPLELVDPVLNSDKIGGVDMDIVIEAGGPGLNGGIASGCGNSLLPGGQKEFYQTGFGASNDCIDEFSQLAMANAVEVSFDITGTWDLENSEFAIMGQNGPNGQSTQCITGRNCSVVPEPLTMVLMGTGLAGLAGAGAISRRRREDEVEAEI